jgi:phosphate transport system permease protein
LALIALLFNIVDGAFGYVAGQNSIDPDALALQHQEETMLGASNILSSEDDLLLAERIAARPYAIGFFGYAYYQQRANDLRVLSVDGIEPSGDSVNSDEYSLSRPLYIYTTEEILREKPQVASFVAHYLANVDSEIGDVGYFSSGADVMSETRDELVQIVGAEPAPPAEVAGPIAMAGSSTVYPLTQRMTQSFEEAGFGGDASLESIGSKAGLRRFCGEGDLDIANASRAIKRAEVELCKAADREPLQIRVGTDALAIVVSAQNEFLTELTTDQLRQVFTTAGYWSDVDPTWPKKPIEKYVPGIDSGTLDFFVESVLNQGLEDLPKEALVTIFQENVSKGLYRRYDSETPFSDRTHDDVLGLVIERVVEPEVVDTWSLSDSVFRRSAVLAEAAAKYPDAEVEFVSWINPKFVVTPQSSDPERAGVRTAIFGSLWVIVITIVFSFPVGVSAAIYLEEYAVDNWLNRIIRTNINNLAGVPSIIYGMLGLAIFVRALEPLSSGTLFGLADPTTANGRTIFSAGLTLGLLILPLIIINAQEAIRAVPLSIRQASYGLGATKWQTIWNHVLPGAIPGVLTGTILAISRALGETAPLVVVGASTFITVDPTGPFSKFTTLPIQIYQWTSRPQDEFRNIAAAAIIVLLVLLLTLNATAVLLRNRFQRRV